jgi:gamma-glutamyltranspeptidase / glutathione hydrolase
MTSTPFAVASEGMISTGHGLATTAGLRVLQDGGNAVDAILTAAAVLGVVLPTTSGIGGDTFAVYYNASERKVRAINASGPAPHALSVEALHRLGHDGLPFRGMLSPTVPGAVDAMSTMLERWGSGRFDLAAVLAPAIHYADIGAPIGANIWVRWNDQRALLNKYPSSRAVFLHDDGRMYPLGALHRQRDLATSLRTIARGGRDAFYEGELAERIVAYSRAHGGVFALEDFASYRCEIVEPLAVRYHNHTIYTNPPPSQGLILLEQLNIVEAFDLGSFGFGSGDAVHALVEAKKLAYADRNAYFGDPAFVTNPTPDVLSKTFAAHRRAEFDPDRAIDAPQAGALPERVGDTTYLCAADRDGNMVSMITSISASFGCGEVIEGTGILLNNRGGRGFRMDPGHPNMLQPGRRTMHTLSAYFVELANGAKLAGGTPGGDAQPQWNLQVLTNLLDFDMNVQEAIDAPRWESTPGTDPAGLDEPFRLALEPGFAPETQDVLASRGHELREADPARGGSVQLIMRTWDRAYFGGADRRTDGSVMGL